MKENILKMLFVVVIIVVGVFLQNKVQNYSILKQITAATREVTNNNKDVQVRVVEKYNNGTEKIVETYIKDGIYVSRIIDGKNTPSNSLTWSTENEDVICNYYYEYEFEYENEVVKGLNCSYNHENNDNNQAVTRKAVGNLLLMYDMNNDTNIFNMPKIKECEYDGKLCYSLEKDYRKWIVDKDTLLTLAIMENVVYDDSSLYLYTFEYDIEEPEGIYDMPNTGYYDYVEYSEINYPTENIEWNAEIKNPISGTDLNPGEELIETVKLKEDEELNFLNITGNEFGLKGFNIHTLENYNKFREKYSGLRELTKEDFKYYYVAIVYKDGYQLNYNQKLDATESVTTNYIFDIEKSKNESIVLIVAPRTLTSKKSEFIVSNDELKITEERAKQIITENIEEINSSLVLDSEKHVEFDFSEITMLDNHVFANLDFIKTPVKGKEPFCWKLTVIDAENTKVDVYVDAVSGNLIGSKNK